MWELNVILRCEADHPNEVPIRQRETSVGSPCAVCGKPLQPRPDRHAGPPLGLRGPPRRRP